MTDRLVTVFGGTGFLGRRIVRQLLAHGFSVRAASRHPERAGQVLGGADGRLHAVAADVHDGNSVAAGCVGAYGAVNAVSLYVEHARQTFHSVHVEAAARVAEQAQAAGIKTLIHVSGIGADPRSRSPYIRSRGDGEKAVRSAFPGALTVRPSVMFGSDDGFLTTLLALLRRLPVFPIFGHGRTRLQPVWVEDVAEAIARRMQGAQKNAQAFECAGPQVYTYAELLETIAAEAGTKPMLVPVPFSLWHFLAYGAELLQSPPITRNQVELMEIDNVASGEVPGFHELGISPRSIASFLQSMRDTARDPSGSRPSRD